MNSEFANDRQSEQLTLKLYHAPQLTVLGPVQQVVKSNPGPGMDAAFGHGGFGDTSAS